MKVPDAMTCPPPPPAVAAAMSASCSSVSGASQQGRCEQALEPISEHDLSQG